MRRVFITGITGQDGSYLAEWLLGRDCEVHGTVRHTDALGQSRIAPLYRDPAVYRRRLFLHEADLDEPATLRRALREVGPDEVYHLAGQSHVGRSFDQAESTCQVTALGTLRLLDMMRELPRPARLFHAGSSEVFGQPLAVPQDEDTPLAPVNPYGCAKAFAVQMVRVYRRAHGLFAVNGILYNHESPRRSEDFVTQKICRAAAAIKLGRQQELMLGDTGAQRDWGHARDYVRAMWLMLQQPEPSDFIIATGALHSVQDVVEQAFATVNLDWRAHVRRDESLLRPAEPRRLVGNAAKAKVQLGWVPEVSFEEMISEMTTAALARLAS